jgi:steroid delta-isomerase-like uncharacterized protein
VSGCTTYFTGRLIDAAELQLEQQSSRERVTIDVDEGDGLVPWHEVADLAASGPTDRHFVVDRDGGRIRFGDGKHGRRPSVGASVRVRLGGGDDIIDRHFAAENAHDVVATLATYTDDVVWDDVTHPLCPVYGKAAAGEIYTGIIDAIPDLRLEPVRRFASADGTAVVDESILTGHVHGAWAGVDGGGAPVRTRILHLFDLRDGLIACENTWFDAAAVLRQVDAYKASRPKA